MKLENVRKSSTKLKIRMYEVEWRIDKRRKKQMRSRSKNLKIVMQRFFILGNKNEKKKSKKKSR